MKNGTIVMCVVALLLGMLLANMLTNVYGCKNIMEGQNTYCGGVANSNRIAIVDENRYELSSDMCNYLSTMARYTSTGAGTNDPQDYFNMIVSEELEVPGITLMSSMPSH